VRKACAGGATRRPHTPFASEQADPGAAGPSARPLPGLRRIRAPKARGQERDAASAVLRRTLRPR